MLSTGAFEQQLRELRTDYVERREAIHKDSHHTEEAVEKDFAEQVTQRENDDVLDALDDEGYIRRKIMRDGGRFELKARAFSLCESLQHPASENAETVAASKTGSVWSAN